MAGMDSIEQVISFSTVVIYWLFTWSCQALLVLGVGWVWLRLDRSPPATTRYRIWLTAVIAVAAIPALSAINRSLQLPAPLIPFPAREFGGLPPPIDIQSVEPQSFSWPSIIWPTLCLLWLAGVIFSFIRLGRSLWKLHRIRSASRPVSLREIDCSSSDLLQADTGAVSIALSERIKSPGVTGLFRPVILLPADIMSWTSREERISMLRHEFAHLERRDQLVSLFQSLLNAILFFHPLLRYASRQLSLEREIACDDRVLSLGTEPKAYAEAILKAVERSFLPDLVHEVVSFTSRRTLERRIEMIMNLNRIAPPRGQWRFLWLPLALIGVCTWLMIPGANSQTLSPLMSSQSGSGAITAARSASAAAPQDPSSPAVDKKTIMVDTVMIGDLVMQVRGLGVLAPTGGGRLKATIQIPEPQAKNLQLNQAASIDTRHGVVSGKVISINPTTSHGQIAVDLNLEGDLPQGMVAGLSVDGLIEVGRLNNVRSLGRPATGREDSVVSLFKLEDDGATAIRVPVRFGKSSVTRIEVLDGLEVGDKVIISDMSQYEMNTIRLK